MSEKLRVTTDEVYEALRRNWGVRPSDYRLKQDGDQVRVQFKAAAVGPHTDKMLGRAAYALENDFIAAYRATVVNAVDDLSDFDCVSIIVTQPLQPVCWDRRDEIVGAELAATTPEEWAALDQVVQETQGELDYGLFNFDTKEI
jgi:hypothetical protein